MDHQQHPIRHFIQARWKRDRGRVDKITCPLCDTSSKISHSFEFDRDMQCGDDLAKASRHWLVKSEDAVTLLSDRIFKFIDCVVTCQHCLGRIAITIA